jgi:hypothetical protein
VIFHRNPFRDCSSFTVAGGGGASGTVETTETNPGPLFVHESGHFLFALVDEYCCNGGYRTDLPCPNLYESQTACQSAAPAVGASTAQCTQINAQGGRVFWRISSAQETMDQQGLNTDFRDDSRACVRRYLEACKTGGSCF